MNWRAFVVGTGALLAAPLAAEAQQTGKVHRIGFLSYLGCGASSDPNGAFRQSLRQLGYVEGRNLVIECRDAPGRVDRLPDLAAELARLRIDVLVAEATPASLAAKQATTAIPIVMLSVADPIRSKLITSLARPGGNLTGVSLFPVLELVPKVLELLNRSFPGPLVWQCCGIRRILRKSSRVIRWTLRHQRWAFSFSALPSEPRRIYQRPLQRSIGGQRHCSCIRYR